MFTRIAKRLWFYEHTERGGTSMMTVHEDAIEALPQGIQDEWETFKQTPSYKVGTPVRISENPDTNADTYRQLLQDILQMRFEDDAEIGSKYFQRAVDWLEGTDFFEAPASGYFHEAFPGGLVCHTLKVYNCLCELQYVDCFKNVKFHSAALVALVHDWCKIGLYESYQKNVKNETTGKWEKELAYRRTTPKFPFGHGDSSLFLANRFFPLTVGESLAVRWHMGKWYTNDADDNDLQAANAQYPIVHMVQFADQLSITNFNN